MKLSIRWKIIGAVLLIIVIGLGTLATSSSIFISSKTEEAVIDQSEVLVDEMANSISTFIDGYEQSMRRLRKR
ncbi:hypothetical protein [Ureibacillus terrenus]|uniref:Uncharacterized protein n=1 Tax=Ureibacillus terrenus TaxID=118246 RepID=A0A540V604_9BACL|nr:hypothetical protein [Ureibacillus terrenus]MED3764645.1 hypothetical protein [Ureibacillus terrenus]TQE92161.1 hypothetical protein FKZ59_00190 [Ureibacillus terrenus]